jgi:menaquinone-dependent protoporphyrinogen oxidase
MIGAFIRYGHFNSALDKFMKHRAEQLNQMLSAFFNNLMTSKPKKRSPQTNVYTRKFLLASPRQLKQCIVFAVAPRYPRYQYFDRIMIQFIM